MTEGSGFQSEAVLLEVLAGLSSSSKQAVMRYDASGVWTHIELDIVESRILETLRANLDDNIDFKGEVAQRFELLLVRLLKFLRQRIDTTGSLFPYLKRYQGGQAPLEKELQDDLWQYLTSSGYTDIERTSVAAGRADIYVPQPSFRLIIEVKRLLDVWTDAAVAPFARQTTAYQQTDIRLGVLAVLDLSDRPAGVPHFDKCMYVVKRDAGPDDKRHAVVMRVPANRRTPSDHAEPGGTVASPL